MVEVETLARAAGGLLWRREADGPRLAVVHRPRRDDWSLPKGRLDPGERWEEAALREVEEETGCRARMLAFAGAVSQLDRRVPKIVLYWHMALVREGALQADDEIDEIRWWSRREALRRLDAASDRRLVARSPPGGVGPGGRGDGGPAAVAALRAELLRQGLALQAAARAAALGPALELLDEADQASARGDPGAVRVLLLAARWLALHAGEAPARARRVAALHSEARRLAAVPGQDGSGAPRPDARAHAPAPRRDEPSTAPVPAVNAGPEADSEGEALVLAPPREAAADEFRRVGVRAARAIGGLALAALLSAVFLPGHVGGLAVFAAAGLVGGAAVAVAALGILPRRRGS